MGYSRPPSTGLQQPRLLDLVRQAIRTKHYSLRTEEAYLRWIKRFILFHNQRHPRDMGCVEVEQFLSDLAVTRHVAAATQNQALSALLFLYHEVLHEVLLAAVAAGTRRGVWLRAAACQSGARGAVRFTGWFGAL